MQDAGYKSAVYALSRYTTGKSSVPYAGSNETLQIVFSASSPYQRLAPSHVRPCGSPGQRSLGLCKRLVPTLPRGNAVLYALRP